ncbi:MAG: histidinol-phosphate transaminase [Victivallales bacterium]|nr:histidinol-phosphate transaminase [Victivallales bacterium]
MNKIYARECIHAIGGYTPGEQLTGRRIVKLNTNENPYPPSPKVGEALHALDWETLRLYPNPTGEALRKKAAEVFGVAANRILCGNGSDDLLTIALRTFVGEGEAYAYPEPSYSLYPVLADLQGAIRRPFQLNDSFELPDDVLSQAADAKLLMLARPNAPTGNATPKARLHELCKQFPGVVWIDEAYADFADDNCLNFVDEFPNVVVSRTFSKSYALAGLRLGLAFAQEHLIEEMLKLKDSYNTDRIAQALGEAALGDQDWLHDTCAKVRATRAWTTDELLRRGWQVLPSQANFLLAKPAHRPADELFAKLRERGLLVRYFALPRVDQFLRITIGTDDEMRELLNALAELDR